MHSKPQNFVAVARPLLSTLEQNGTMNIHNIVSTRSVAFRARGAGIVVVNDPMSLRGLESWQWCGVIDRLGRAGQRRDLGPLENAKACFPDFFEISDKITKARLKSMEEQMGFTVIT